MLQHHGANARGLTRTGWLESRHSFSFGEFYDEARMGFGRLRVINEDVVAAGAGFPTHAHRDMEILTFVLSGALSHKDSLGTGATIAPGEVQRMSAGTGISHSEFNARADAPCHLLQIWILPEARGIAPSYEQKDFSAFRAPGQLTLLASPDGRQGSLTIHAQAEMAVLDLEGGQGYRYAVPPGRDVWIQAAGGRFTVNGQAMQGGDGLAVRAEVALEFSAQTKCEVLVFVV